MNSNERNIARLLFRSKIQGADGSAFEQLFSSLMELSQADFIQVRPQGQHGDKKNDGFIPSTGTFFQCYGPEDISTKDATAKKKLETDFNGLMEFWPSQGFNVKNFYYVVNDKFHNVGPLTIAAIHQLNQSVPEVNIQIMMAKDLDKIFMSLSDEDKIAIIGFIPQISFEHFEYHAMSEVITHIMNYEVSPYPPTIPTNPDLIKKIEFNNLSEATGQFLKSNLVYINAIDDYFEINNDFQKEELRDKFNGLYIQAIRELGEDAPDDIFWFIYQKVLPTGQFSTATSTAVFTLMAYYFETCDIFKIPEDDIAE